MVSKYEDIIEFLKADLSKENVSLPEKFEAIVKQITASLKGKVDSAKDRLIEYGTKAFEKHAQTAENTGGEFKLPEDNDKSKNIKDKVHDLVASLDEMLKKTQFLDETITQIKEDPTSKLLVVSKDVLNFRPTRKFIQIVDGKASTDLGWNKSQNKQQCSKINTNDDLTLDITGSCCYNYYQTDKEFSTEDVETTFITNGYSGSSYFYFGVRNENCVPDSNCMCCTPSSVTYFTMDNGSVKVNGSCQTESKLLFNNSSKSEVRIRIKLMASEKKVYFEVNDQGECGPYALQGSRWTFTSGSCNTVTGFIRIESSLFI